LVAFSVETNDDVLTVEARRKLDDKRVDLLVANSAKVAFDNKTNQVSILSKDKVVKVANAHKLVVARKILNQVVKKIAIGQ
jgi:phosphopantothenoylcysteine synthetase/decarboxylase